jgi:hypothetical protein
MQVVQVHDGRMVLMAVMLVVLLVGVALTLKWGSVRYRTWVPGPGPNVGPEPEPEPGPDGQPSVRTVAMTYWRGLAIALVGGFWAGALVTGPAVRLAMRLLAATAGDDAQGRLTDADEVVGNIDVGGTFALYVFGGLLPGLVSGVIYVVCRRLLPVGVLGGVIFGAFHLVVFATRIDPLRPENPDFDLVGPGWLSVVVFAGASVLHGMAVVAMANRYSYLVPPEPASVPLWRMVVPLAPPVVIVVAAVAPIVAIVMGLLLAIVVSRLGFVVRVVRSRAVVRGGQLVFALLALALLPGAISDVHDVIVRDGAAASLDVLTAHVPGA